MSSSPQQYPVNPYSPQATLGPSNKPPAAPINVNGGGSGWKWMFLIFGIFGMGFVACCGICGGAIYWIASSIEQSRAYEMAMDKVHESVEVKDKIGNPVVGEPILNGSNTRIANGEQSSHFSIKVTGPHGEATVVVDASGRGEDWKLDKCTVNFADGTSHELVVPTGVENAAPAPNKAESGEMNEDEPAEGASPAP